MRLALLAGGSPERSIDGPFCRVAKGKYQLHVEGRKDSELVLDVEGGLKTPFIGSFFFMLTEHSTVSVKWIKRGTEKSITVIAERVS